MGKQMIQTGIRKIVAKGNKVEKYVAFVGIEAKLDLSEIDSDRCGSLFCN